MIHKDLNKKESGAEMRIEWLSRLEEIENLKEKWFELEASVSDRTVMSSYDYVIPWYRHYSGTKKDQYGEPLLGLAWQGNELVGVAPFTFWKGTLGKIPVHRVDFVGHNAEAGEFLVQDGREDTISSFIDSLIREVPFDVICLNNFDTNTKKYQSLVKIVASYGLRVELSEHRYAIVDLQDGHEAYCKRMSRNFRNNLKRHAKRMAVAGDVNIDRFHATCSEHKINEYLLRTCAIGDKSWKARTNVSPAMHHRLFAEEIAMRFAKRGMVDLSILTINGSDAAYILALVERGVYYDFTISFDDSFKDLFP